MIPDIILPDPYYLLDQGEKEQDYPMKWDEIAPADYKPLTPAYSVEKLKANSEARMKSNPGFTILADAAKRLKKQKDNTIVSLNFDKYKTEQNKYKEEAKKMEDLDKEIPGVEVVALTLDMPAIAADTAKAAKAKDWYKSIKKDIYLNETIAIMDDMK